MITIKPVYSNLGRCNICGISVNHTRLYKIILDNETRKPCSHHTIELCNFCMILLGNKLYMEGKNNSEHRYKI